MGERRIRIQCLHLLLGLLGEGWQKWSGSSPLLYPRRLTLSLAQPRQLELDVSCSTQTTEMCPTEPGQEHKCDSAVSDDLRFLNLNTLNSIYCTLLEASPTALHHKHKAQLSLRNVETRAETSENNRPWRPTPSGQEVEGLIADERWAFPCSHRPMSTKSLYGSS
ncbi:hypothetical protein MHYP_G00196700 [Metynnis hypsauchen]